MMGKNVDTSGLTSRREADSGNASGTGCFMALMTWVSKVCMGIAALFILAYYVYHH